MTDPYLSIDNVVKRFDATLALDNVGLTVDQGEFVCFLGPSGCGKTTLLRAIAGLDIQTSGTIIQNGVDVSILPPEQRDFGIVFQSYALFPNLTVAQNIAFGLENTKMVRNEIVTRVEELLDLVDLSDHATKYPAQLSGGQQQRVALARALAISPGLLLLDEPLSALDARVRKHLRGEIKALQRRLGVTTIMVTHDQEEALAMADRIVVMNAGRIEQVGTPQEIYAEPASAFVAEFIGAMNLLPATTRAGESSDHRVIDLGQVTLETIHCPGHPAGPVKVAVRPEDLRLHIDGRSGVNHLPVTVTHLEFMGSYMRAGLICRGSGGIELEAEISANAARDLALETGMAATVEIPRDRVRIFSGEA